MKFKEISAFQAVMRSGSMTAAAAELYTSQPNVSRMIAQLEYSTGLTLFARNAGRLTPTEEGLAFLREVERAFVGLDALKDAARNIRQFGKGRLRIAAVPSLAMTVLPLVLQRFHAEFPDVNVAMETGSTQLVADRVGSRYCDLGLVSFLPPAAVTEAQPIAELAGCCVVPPGHRLAGQDVITAADLAGESFISMSHGDGLRAAVDAAFADDDQRVMHFETPYGATICKLVGLGLGVGIVNPLVARAHAAEVVARPFQPAIPFVSYLLLARNRPVNVLVDRFTERMKEVIDAEMASLPPGLSGFCMGA
ncbi:LysR family transcriptional regulator [Cupriavidus gilardii]|uniref:LysR substrate-binding domain-containing protein n=1 Tax=Cupriavidus gilardii TaxID=82541 RepID=UPI0015743806|nr:LysR substrate-binding domain-containing protein [Cupriavidus gilardii]MCG5262787.1 LysR substrate-binding domain-containing protein [Cupriavidus gilardii]MDF9432226.1 LysR family transcriptional regulator [Cupriavidus gilardii]NSX05476.1 LysR family transcriptional regulator [Cupriavidus gilardii]